MMTSPPDLATQEERTGPRVLDLFSGAGGLSLGFRQAGYDVVGGVDNNAPAVETFDANFGRDKGLCCDLRDPDLTQIRRLTGSAGVDVIVGGPSCQGFSTSGGLSKGSGRDETDPRNRLFTNYMAIVDDLQPSWIVFENVTGLLLYNQGRVALDIVRAFKEVGYNVAPMILLAADYGVPQLRRRLVFVGNRTGADICFPAATNGDPSLWRDYALPFAHLSRLKGGGCDQAAPHVTFADACGDLPPVAEGGTVDGDGYPLPPTTDYQRMMRKGSTGVSQHAAADLSPLDRLAAQTLKEGENWRAMPASSLPDRFKRIRPYDATTLLKRLSSNRPAYTITTKFNEATTGAFIHPEQARTITLREAARLQSFPDVFRFSGSAAQIRQQIGNAVPPLLSRVIGEAILPGVTRDVTGRACAPLRDVVVVGHKVDEDVLRLKAPRKPRLDEEMPGFEGF